ncbi:type II secretion system protein [Methylomonas sp. LL1]|uniref:type II secretion system GspH family protein n=1 Tax=Methylomonas sp. LL1 TaxID=2785785 RepID=UPI0018C38C75|nr:type II secretion system GspH family protein [Methylomonas sp. LL1]QPK61489.1 type II secretion system protein [Methylomonas sp. LL1]
MMDNKIRQQGLTLLELAVVLLIMIALGGLALPYVAGTGQMAACQATDATMLAVKEAIVGGGGPGYYDDLLGQMPRNQPASTDYNLRYLFEKPAGWGVYKPSTAIGWRGPYLQGGESAPGGLDASFIDVFDASGNPAGKVHAAITSTAGFQVPDAWHRPIVLQIPYYDPDGTGTEYSAGYYPDQARLVSAGPNGIITTPIDDGDADPRGDDRVLLLKIPDPGGNTPCDKM